MPSSGAKQRHLEDSGRAPARTVRHRPSARAVLARFFRQGRVAAFQARLYAPWCVGRSGTFGLHGALNPAGIPLSSFRSAHTYAPPWHSRGSGEGLSDRVVRLGRSPDLV